MNLDFLWASIGVAVCAIIGAVSVLVFNGKEDNPVEETAEAVIYVLTGEDVDLTPTSPERKR